MIVETVQGEGGLHAASMAWLQRLEACCRRHGALLIVDDIQAGCGRTGSFFSFEPAGISPDIICLSKSISGSGLPMALTLIRPELDIWQPASTTAPSAGQQRRLHHRCRRARLVDRRQPVAGSRSQGQPRARRTRLDHRRARAAPRHDRGRGLLVGLHTPIPDLAGQIGAAAFQRGLLLEPPAADDDVVKLMRR